MLVSRVDTRALQRNVYMGKSFLGQVASPAGATWSLLGLWHGSSLGAVGLERVQETVNKDTLQEHGLQLWKCRGLGLCNGNEVSLVVLVSSLRGLAWAVSISLLLQHWVPAGQGRPALQGRAAGGFAPSPFSETTAQVEALKWHLFNELLSAGQYCHNEVVTRSGGSKCQIWFGNLSRREEGKRQNKLSAFQNPNLFLNRSLSNCSHNNNLCCS